MNCPQLISKYNTPKICWYQTDLTVIISIQLIDVPKYYLQVQNDHLLFSTKINGKEYHFILYLFGPVLSEKTLHKNVGREIKIYLTKALKWFPWLRLIISKEKNPFITYDTDHVYDADNILKKSYQAGRFQEYKRLNNILCIKPDVPSSDEEDSEDECLDFSHYS